MRARAAPGTELQMRDGVYIDAPAFAHLLLVLFRLPLPPVAVAVVVVAVVAVDCLRTHERNGAERNGTDQGREGAGRDDDSLQRGARGGCYPHPNDCCASIRSPLRSKQLETEGGGDDGVDTTKPILLLRTPLCPYVFKRETVRSWFISRGGGESGQNRERIYSLVQKKGFFGGNDHF
jgi:hypothetical protein